MAGSILADHHRQLCKSVEPRHWDDRPFSVDQVELAVMLPDREWLALDEANVQRIGEPALDYRGPDPSQRLKPLLGSSWAHGQDRRAGSRAEGRQNCLAIGHLSTLDFDVRYDEAQPRGAIDHPIDGVLHCPLNEGRSAPLICRVKHPHKERRDTDPHREPTDGRCDAAASWVPRYARPHSRHNALSTIQETSSSNPIPTLRAISGTNEVGVIPG